MDYTVHGILQARILGWVAFRDLPNPGIKPRSSALQADSLLGEPQGKPKNTVVGSPSLLHWIFQTQELNQGLLHCWQILNQQSYQGSHFFFFFFKIKHWKPEKVMDWSKVFSCFSIKCYGKKNPEKDLANPIKSRYLLSTLASQVAQW